MSKSNMMAILAASMMMDSSLPSNRMHNIKANTESKGKVIPKGCKEYKFKYWDNDITPNLTGKTIIIIAINQRSANRKFEKWLNEERRKGNIPELPYRKTC